MELKDALNVFATLIANEETSKEVATEKFLSTKDVATRYNVSIYTVRNWIANKKLIPDMRLPGRGCYRFKEETLKKFEQRRK